jgi:ribosomal protein S18 acetylase RimI-like enzyme
VPDQEITPTGHARAALTTEAVATRAPAVVVRPATPSDLHRTAELQIAGLGNGLFPRLGHRFVRRWHGTYIGSPHGLLLVATEGRGDGAVLGYLVGSSDQVAHVADTLREHRLGLGVAGAGALLLRPRVLAVFLRTRLKPYARRLTRAALRRPAAAPASPTGPVPGSRIAVVTGIVVDASARGRGVGRLLLDGFVSRCAAAGASGVELVTSAGEAGASGFYRAAGWKSCGEHITRDGVLVEKFCLDLTAGGAGRP